ncbi:A/G-specific adenine glycosylase, partial [Micrococcus sp. ACRRV]|nr:A/G-specific adenine glycosylase [Micrococcus sp. ACRRV]
AVRGAVMAAVREHGRVPRGGLREAVDGTGRLGAHTPDDAQWERAVAGLLGDGLLVAHDDGALAFPA